MWRARSGQHSNVMRQRRLRAWPQAAHSARSPRGVIPCGDERTPWMHKHHARMQAQREVLGDQHPDTLASIKNMASLLQDQGDLEGAARTRTPAAKRACCQAILQARWS